MGDSNRLIRAPDLRYRCTPYPSNTTRSRVTGPRERRLGLRRPARGGTSFRDRFFLRRRCSGRPPLEKVTLEKSSERKKGAWCVYTTQIAPVPRFRASAIRVLRLFFRGGAWVTFSPTHGAFMRIAVLSRVRPFHAIEVKELIYAHVSRTGLSKPRYTFSEIPSFW